MDALDILVAEHVLIKRYLETLNLAVQKMERGDRLPREFFEGATEFARDYADRFHHYKEEHEMFGLLAQKAGGEFDGPIEVLRQQHESGRAYISTIRSSLEGYEAGDSIKESAILESLAAFRSLLNQHIHREDGVFFPMARQQLSEDDNRLLLEVFRAENLRVGEDYQHNNEELVTFLRGLISD
jgi:hemerythrin-like domain-containing protein